MPRSDKQYLIIGCTVCGRLLLATSDKRTRTCPYCGKRVKTQEAQVMARSESPEVARRTLQDAKTRLQGKVPAKSGDGR